MIHVEVLIRYTVSSTLINEITNCDERLHAYAGPVMRRKIEKEEKKGREDNTRMLIADRISYKKNIMPKACLGEEKKEKKKRRKANGGKSQCVLLPLALPRCCCNHEEGKS